MKRMPALLLALALLLGACTPAKDRAAQQAAPTADDVAQAVLTACGMASDDLEQLHSILDDAGLSAYLVNFYGLSDGSWDDCAIYRAAASAEAFEIAVIRLTSGADTDAVLDGLEKYLLDRQSAFTGYAPEQAAIIESSCAALSSGGQYAALLICEEADAACAAFYSALDQTAPEPDPSPSPLSDPAAYAGRIPYTDPGTDDMTLYDTSAILAAWTSGDSSALSDYDQTIYDRAAQVLQDVLTDDMTDYQKERAIYSWVVAHVSYDYDNYDYMAILSPDSSTPYNPLVEGKGICLGFAVTFQLFLDMAGVECITVTGATSSSRQNHAWNMVRLSGEWYCVDATWDNGLPSDQWLYFNVTSDFMAETGHQWDYANTPEATADDGGES